MTNVKTPDAVGVPASVAVPSPLSVKVMPARRLPVSLRVAVGNPAVVMVKLSAWPVTMVAALPLVMTADPPTTMSPENSDVLPAGSVAVALTTNPTGAAAKVFAKNVALPLASVVTVMKPRKICPCPWPEASAVCWRRIRSGTGC